ncbi:FAD-dependent tricarballylate dehydrogenase TcuA [Halomarina pelagica]|uniref:FAD-dependent tricarballylate dehydrogenase TcuA n=1 Tax=Halomarina pelagica TaxID=2961599 RepID=UPI0020C563E2|nr:FAD-dependent tricarballylate dehydrogenase TcuA [Halomarina sp. BND7]
MAGATTTGAYDLVVVGCGMAGLAAAVRAGELGLETAVLEKTPREKRGGQTRYVQSFRVPSADCDLSPWGLTFDVPDYTVEAFYDDVMRQTSGRADPDLARTLVEEAGPTVEWLTENGVEWSMEPLHVGYTVGRTFCDGEDLVATLVERAEELGATVFYDTEVRAIHETADRRVAGVRAISGDEPATFEADAVVVAGGGYESDPRKRTAYYGPDYDAMTVRGSPYNTGEAIDAALDAGARAAGQWSGAHMALIDANSPEAEGGANRIDGYQYCVLLNHEGERFVDEGRDARAHTYAEFGRRIFEQPGHEAFIVADAGMEAHLWPDGPSDPTYGETVADVLERLGCEDPERGEETVEAYNAACDPTGEFDPDALDGNRAAGIDPPKSNWAIPLEEPPYVGYPVTGGITFAFGGVEIDAHGRVLDTRGRTIPGLYAAGNSTGGLFFDNYPGGTGLTNAAVFGRRAAEAVAEDGV